MDSALHPAGVFYMFSFFALVGFVFVWIWFLETKYLSEKQKKSLYSPNYGKTDEGLAET